VISFCKKAIREGYVKKAIRKGFAFALPVSFALGAIDCLCAAIIPCLLKSKGF